MTVIPLTRNRRRIKRNVYSRARACTRNQGVDPPVRRILSFDQSNRLSISPQRRRKFTRRPCLFIERIVINTVNFDPVLFRLRISVDDCRAYIKRRINVSRPVKGSKPIFDRFHRLRYVSLEQTIRADNRGFRNFQCSSLLIIITINAIRSWKFKKEKRKRSVPHPCIRLNDSFVRIVLIPLETISTGEIITQEYSSANENVHNTDFVGLKNTRYIFFIERFARMG